MCLCIHTGMDMYKLLVNKNTYNISLDPEQIQPNNQSSDGERFIKTTKRLAT